MEKLCIFCKSYIGDFEQLKKLKESIDEYNADNIPFCICIPKSDLPSMNKLINGNEKYTITIITDEEVLGKTNDAPQNWLAQQVIKLSIHKSNQAEFYSIIDSDCYFIANFYFSDFMYNEKTPYTIIRSVPPRARTRHNQEFIKEYFKRDGFFYHFGGMGIVFSSYVLNELEKYCLSNNKTINDLIEMSSNEYFWYGEFLYKLKPFEIIPMSILFCEFHHHSHYLDFRKVNTLEDIRKAGYIGITMQSGWVKNIEYREVNPIISKYYKSKKTVLEKIYARGNEKKITKRRILMPYYILKEMLNAK